MLHLLKIVRMSSLVDRYLLSLNLLSAMVYIGGEECNWMWWVLVLLQLEEVEEAYCSSWWLTKTERWLSI